jgi:hypothetical protein
MATASEGSRHPTDGSPQEKPPRKFSQVEDERTTGSLRHLFGPAVLIAVVCFIFITFLLCWKIPDHPTDDLAWVKVATNQAYLKELFDLQLKEYKAGLVKLDAYLGLQALLVATTVLVIIRRSDSLNLFGNSIPLSWLHFFIPMSAVSTRETDWVG